MKSKNLTALITTLTLAAALITGCGANQAAQAPSDSAVSGKDTSITVEVSVEGPEKDLFDGQVKLDQGATAYDALQATGLDIKTSGNGETAYVTEIEGAKAGDYGASSGWLYDVNDKMPDVGAGQYELTDGDEVVWDYYRDDGTEPNPFAAPAEADKDDHAEKTGN